MSFPHLFPAVVDVIPSVIEPSFGIGRILYTILEHSYRVREEDEQRKWLALPSLVAPISCSVLPLSGNEEFIPFIAKIGEERDWHSRGGGGHGNDHTCIQSYMLYTWCVTKHACSMDINNRTLSKKKYSLNDIGCTM